MATVTLKGEPFDTVGELPAVGTAAPGFALVRQDLSEATLQDYLGKSLILNIFPSLDTPTCSASVKAFWEKSGQREDVMVLNISMDLPFAHARFCQAEGLDHVKTLSAFRSPFGEEYGIAVKSGPLRGLLSRAVVVIDSKGQVVYRQLISEVTEEPDYAAVLDAV